MIEICGCGHYMFPLPERVNYCNNEDYPGWGKNMNKTKLHSFPRVLARRRGGSGHELYL